MLRLLAAFALLALPAWADFRDIEGTAGYSEKAALPAEAVLEVQLLEIAEGDPAPVPIASVSVRAFGAQPFPFRLVFDDAMIDRSRTYALAARIRHGEETLFETAEGAPMFSGIASGPPRIQMVRAEPPDGAPQPELERSAWVLDEMAAGQMAPASPARIAFDDENRVRGTGGCNDFSANYRVDPPKGLSFGKLASTLRGCSAETAQQERLVFRALGRTRGYAIEDSALVLTDEDGKALLRFRQLR